MMDEVVKKQKNEPQAASSTHCYTGPGDVECDSCIGRKRKALNFCLVCQASYCEDHLQPHYQSPTFKKHKLVKAGAGFQKEICSQHDKLMEIYCRTDQSLICYLCMMDKHKGHNTVSAKAERTEKQNELQKKQMKFQQRIQNKQMMVQELKQTVVSIKRRSQAAVEDSERIFTELISSMEKKRLEATELIRAHEKTELRQAKQLLNQLEQEIADLQRRVVELEQLSHTDDDIHFLQSFPSLRVSPVRFYPSGLPVNQHLSFDGVRKSLSDLKKRVEEICAEEFNKVRPQGVKILHCEATVKPMGLDLFPRHSSTAAATQMILPSEPKLNRGYLQHGEKRAEDILHKKHHPPAAAVQMSSQPEPTSREDFLQYFCSLTLDPNTAHHRLILSEMNRALTFSHAVQTCKKRQDRFDTWPQVLCNESVCGRCYWEVEWSGDVEIAVSYKEISRKGRGFECRFGRNSQSWSVACSSSSVSFSHNNIEIKLQAPASSRIGVYVDHTAGTLSFYGVSDTMSLLHKVHTTFTQPLYAGSGLWNYNSTLRLL